MLLSKFIVSNVEEIVTEWESFASTMLPEKQFDRATLRDDAADIRVPRPSGNRHSALVE
jgi:hypothetical protein